MGNVVSPVFCGREAELRTLGDAFVQVLDGESRAVLVEGAAGLGKSRLLCEFEARARDRCRLVRGDCIRLSDGGLPYGPFAAILRQLVREVGASAVAALAGTEAATELARLSLLFGPPPREATDRTRLFEAVLILLERLAEARPLVLLVEDLHWAHSTTRDLLVFLVRNLPPRVLLVTSSRPSGPAAGQGLPVTAAELARLGHVTRLLLAPLDGAEVARQVEGIVGRAASPELIAAVHRRGGGVPLFTEALVDPGGGLASELPASLQDLLLAPVAGLPEATRAVLHAAALAEARVEPRLLAAALGSDPAAIEAALDPARRAHLVAGLPDALRFRHELIREAIEGHLAPDERRRLHRALAKALEASAPLGGGAWNSARLARHWRGAGDAAAAMSWAWTAAREAACAYAYAEQLRLLEQVLELWPLARDVADRLAIEPVAVRELAADAACWAVEIEPGLRHAEAALALLGEPAGDAAAVRVAALLLQRAAIRQQALHPGQVDDLRRAIAIAPAMSRVRAEGLAQLCRALILAQRPQEARQPAADLRRLADSLADEEYRIEGLITAGQLAAAAGEDAARILDDALGQARRAGLGRLEVLAWVAIADSREARGDHVDAIAAGRAGLARAAELGQTRYRGAALAASLARALMAVGDGGAARAVVDDALSLDPAPFGRGALLICRARLALAEGDLAGCAAALAAAGAPPQHADAEGHLVLPRAALEIEHRVAAGDLAGGADAVAAAMPLLANAQPRFAWPLIVAAVEACRGIAEGADSRAATRASRLLADLLAHARRTPRPGPPEAAFAARVAAEAERAPAGLTRREVEVLRLVAAGRSNPEIAAELLISAKTASVHVSNILGKLDVPTRSAAASAAWRLRLVS